MQPKEKLYAYYITNDLLNNNIKRKIAKEDFEKIHLVGSGGFSKVYKGIFI